MNKIYGLCDIYIQALDKPYTFTAFGRTMMEAMQSELAIITTGSEEYLEGFVPCRDLLLVEPNNVDELANAINKLIKPINVKLNLHPNDHKRTSGNRNYARDKLPN